MYFVRKFPDYISSNTSSQPPSDEQPEAVIEDAANPVSKNSEKINSESTKVCFYHFLSKLSCGKLARKISPKILSKVLEQIFRNIIHQKIVAR